MEAVGSYSILKFCLVIAITFLIITTLTFSSGKGGLKSFRIVAKDSLDVKEMSKQKYFPNDCNCQSLFTINACNGPNAILNISEYDWKIINRDIQRFRSGKPVLLGNIMTNLARFLPQTYRVRINGIVNVKLTFKEVIQLHFGKFAPVRHDNIIPRKSTRTPNFSSCNVYFHSPQDIKRCTNLLHNVTGKPLKIAFVGDSMIRSIMEELVNYTYKDLNLSYYNSSYKLNIKKDFLEVKAKYNVPIVGNGLEVRFYWAPYLENLSNSSNMQPGSSNMQPGARDVLESWVNEPKVIDPIPDILYIGGGLWDGIHESGIEATEDAIARMKNIQAILENLSKRVRIIWHMHPFVKYYAASVIVPNGALEMMNQLSWLKLKQSNIWMWESLAILTIKEYKQCEYYVKANLLKYIPRSWKCTDPQHPGKMARKGGMNMIWNLSCNRILGIEKMCCS